MIWGFSESLGFVNAGYLSNKSGIDFGLALLRCLVSLGTKLSMTNEGRAKMDKENLFLMDLAGRSRLCKGLSADGGIDAFNVSQQCVSKMVSSVRGVLVAGGSFLAVRFSNCVKLLNIRFRRCHRI